MIETKLWDRNFWGKEEYCSHFENEDTRVLLAISVNKMLENRQKVVRDALKAYDVETTAKGRTALIVTTFSELISNLRQVILQSRSKAQLELEEILADYEDFAYGHGLISDINYRMHVFAINDSETDNCEYTLYYNQADRRERPHKFIGLYRNKTIKYVAEVGSVVIPRRNANGQVEYTILVGEENFNDEKRARLERFFSDEGWGDDGKVKFHLFDKLHTTDFRKTSAYGIMGPRHFDLRDHIDTFPENFNAEWLAEELSKQTWD